MHKFGTGSHRSPSAFWLSSALKGSAAVAALIAMTVIPAVAADNNDSSSKSNTTMSGDDISKTGSTTTNDALKAMPSLGSFNATGTNAGQSASALVSSPAVHGLGDGLTIVLLNGHRMQGAGVYSDLPDPSEIPSGAIDHIEVRDDGGNAVYGTDAISGVVNFVLKKDYNGAQTTFHHGIADGYQNWSVGQLFGTTWDGGSLMVDYEHSQNTHLAAKKRDYISMNQSKYYGSDYDLRNTICSPANITVGGSTYGLQSDGSVSSDTNKCETEMDNDLVPAMAQDHGLISVHQMLTQNIELHADVLYSYHTMTAAIGAQSTVLGSAGTSVTVPSTSPYYISVNGSTDDETVTYNPSDDVGVLHNGIIMGGLNATVGEQAHLGGSWYELTDLTVGLEDDSAYIPGINQTYAQEAAEDGTLNPYGIGEANSADVIGAVRDYADYYTSRQSMLQWVNRFMGNLTTLPGGNVTLTAGLDFRTDTYHAGDHYGAQTENDLLSDDSGALNSFETINHRTTYSVYGDMNIPIIGARNGFRFFRGLDLDLALRYDHYDDGVNTTNPHIKLTWTPTNGLEIYGSYSTSLRPVDFTYMGNSVDHRVFVYSDLTGSGNANAYSLVLAGGGDGLKPETAKNMSAGFRISSPIIPGFTGGINYFRILYSNVITIAYNALTSTNSIYDDYRIYSPTKAEAEEWTTGFRHDGTFDLDSNLPTAIYDLTRHNLAKENIEGFDFSGNYAFDTDYGHFSVGTTGTLMISYEETFYASGKTDDQLNTENMVGLKWRDSFMWAKGPLNAAIFVNYTDGYRNTNVTAHPHVDSFTTMDTHIGYQLPNIGYMKGVSVSVDVSNILDTDPPHYYAASTAAVEYGYDPTNASAMGRMITFGITKNW